MESPGGDLHLKQVQAMDVPAEIGATDLVLGAVFDILSVHSDGRTA